MGFLFLYTQVFRVMARKAVFPLIVFWRFLAFIVNVYSGQSVFVFQVIMVVYGYFAVCHSGRSESRRSEYIGDVPGL